MVKNLKHWRCEGLLLLLRLLPVAPLRNRFSKKRVQAGLSGQGRRQIERWRFVEMV
jgi:hypothetical protein